MTYLRWSIQKKLVVILALCALFFVVIAAPILSYTSYKNHKENANIQQARLVGAVKVSAAIAVFVKNKEIANDVLIGLLQDDEIKAARLIGTDEFSIHANSDSSQTSPLAENTASHYPLMSPVEINKRIGGIQIWANEDLISKRAIQKIASNIAWLVILSFLLALASIFAANKLIGSPLRKLARQLSGVKPGSEQAITVANSHENDEIGLVAKSVNNFLSVTNQAIRTERDLRLHVEKMDRHYRNIFSSSHVGIMILDENGFLIRHNPVLLDRILKLTDKQLARLNTEEFFSLTFKKPDLAWNLVSQARKHGDVASIDLELNSADADPTWVHCILSVNHDEDTQGEIIEAVLYDITSRVQETNKAKQLSEEDPLTGLKNRRGCADFYQTLIDEGLQDRIVIMLLDLDGFKPVNDKFGHAIGDHTLLTIAKRLHFSVRSATDLIGRFGGDEFLVILQIEASNTNAIEKLAKQIIKHICEPINIESGQSISIGVSIGIATAQDHKDFETLIQAADQAMYRVKASGKNNYIFAESNALN